MFLKKKKKISSLIDTVSEMLGVLPQLNNRSSYISECLMALDVISLQLNNEEIIPAKTLEKLQNIQKSLINYVDNDHLINQESVDEIYNQLLELKSLFQEEIKTKLNIVFFPYKVSMWDSLESIYKSAVKDENCVAHVVPIPYYQLSQNESIPTYEGDRFPNNIPITHFTQYDLEEQDPDIIYVHNIYDGNNTLTRVYEEYFTYNLKKYTDMLVFVPYHSPHFMFQDSDRRSLGYGSPSMKYVDKIILANEMVKNAAIQDGIPEEKLLVLGSPKLDSMVEALKKEISYPEGWVDKISGKTVYLVNTGCLFFANNPFLAFEKLIDLFNIPRYIEDVVIIWRPHPLTNVSILQYTPYFSGVYLNLIDRYKKEEDQLFSGVIVDETDDYIPALKAADVIISRNGSLLRSYILTEKKVIYWDENLWENTKLPNSQIPSDVFYYAFDKSEPWYKLVRKFSQGYDPRAKNRKDLASKAYVNIDGSAGSKIHFSIKESVLKG